MPISHFREIEHVSLKR